MFIICNNCYFLRLLYMEDGAFIKAIHYVVLCDCAVMYVTIFILLFQINAADVDQCTSDIFLLSRWMLSIASYQTLPIVALKIIKTIFTHSKLGRHLFPSQR